MVEGLMAGAVAAALVVAAAVGALALAPTAADATTSESCTQEVAFTDFRTTAAADAMNQTGSATATRENTRVTLEEATGFIRLRASNPNGYCVRYVVEIGPDVVAPADLGTITSNSDDVEATWRASQNLTSGEVYTRVSFTLSAGENATFAPSKIRVQSLSWTGQAKQKATGATAVLRDLGLDELLGDDDLAEREYTITPSDSTSRVTVPLSNGSRAVEDWQATYTIDGTTRPVTQSADEPVFYTESDDAVTFHFNPTAVKQGASVRFTAEPTTLDKISYSANSYFSETPLDGVLEGLFGAATPTAAAGVSV